MTTNKPEVVAYHHTNKENPEHRGVSLRRDLSCTSTLINTEPLIRLSDYQRLQAECYDLREKLEVVEKQRPYWAKGYSTDSIAAQVSGGALSELWELLGVSNQTDAVEKLQMTNKPSFCPECEKLVEALEAALFGTPLDDVPNRDNDDIWRMCYPHLPERASGVLRDHLARIETALAAHRKV